MLCHSGVISTRPSHQAVCPNLAGSRLTHVSTRCALPRDVSTRAQSTLDSFFGPPILTFTHSQPARRTSVAVEPARRFCRRGALPTRVRHMRVQQACELHAPSPLGWPWYPAIARARLKHAAAMPAIERLFGPSLSHKPESISLVYGCLPRFDLHQRIVSHADPTTA